MSDNEGERDAMADDLEQAADEMNEATEQPDWEELSAIIREAKKPGLSKAQKDELIARAKAAVPADRTDLIDDVREAFDS